MKIGFVGLGKMGSNMVLRLLEGGVEVVAWNRSKEPLEEVVKAGAIGTSDLKDLVNKLGGVTRKRAPIASPASETRTDDGILERQDPDSKIVWVMLPAGSVTDEFIHDLAENLTSGDIIIDGGNGFYKDSQSRYQTLATKGIHLLDIGVSGGPGGAKTGACLMIGGDQEIYQKLESLFKVIAAPGAYKYLGRSGAGHFAKMVHNGVEYGMMQALAEGVGVLDKSEFDFNLEGVMDLYNNRSVVESRLVGWLEEALKEDPKLQSYSSKIDHTGEGLWTVKTAQELGVEVPIIEKSLQVRVDSESEPDNIRNRAVSAMRGKFGGHAVKK